MPTLRELVDRFVVQYELAAGDRHKERARRVSECFIESLEEWFFAAPVLADDEPIGYLLPENCVKPMAKSGLVTAGDFRAMSWQDLYAVPNLGPVKVAEVCEALARFGVVPKKNVS